MVFLARLAFVLCVCCLATVEVDAQSVATSTDSTHFDLRDVTCAEAEKFESRDRTFAGRLVEGAKVRPRQVDTTKGVLLFPVLLEGDEVWALVDSRSSGTLMSIAFAEAHGMEVQCASRRTKTSFADLPVGFVEEVQLEIPHQFAISAAFDAVDLSGMSEALGRDIAIVIGADLLRSFAFVYDGRRELIVFRGSGGITPRWADTIVYDLEGDTFAAEVEGRLLRLGVDLGSNSELLLARVIANEILGGRESYITRSVDASGSVARLKTYSSVSFRHDSFETTLTAKSIEQVLGGFDGLIGFPLFEGKQVLFDFGANQIVVAD